MAAAVRTDEAGTWNWPDPLDAAVPWAEVERVVFQAGGQARWEIELASRRPRAARIDPDVIIAYGLVLDTTGDGAADYVVGIDNDAPERGDLHVWVTDLATGDTDQKIGAPYGYPIEFSHPEERPSSDPTRPGPMMFTFLEASTPADLNPATVRFYAWTSATRDGEVIASDYAPDTGWISRDPT